MQLLDDLPAKNRYLDIKLKLNILLKLEISHILACSELRAGIYWSNNQV